MRKTYKSLAFIGIIFIVTIALMANDSAVLIKTHDVTVSEIHYGTENINSGYRSQTHKVRYVEIKSWHGNTYKIYAKKNKPIYVNSSIKIYEYKTNHSDLTFFTFTKKANKQVKLVR